ncbi:PREDICTED: probable receptor-like protein kinase At1g80640 isoform X1 [Populus euphratica]|uniref:Probable receptor-like protein kinase At1g80640 isoform X1 n=1 Tax=Populus euphratica TaxID=75702 RepID=A0AAJ6XXI5_POPEU|nr:PREDICTED: probable receptor-like protein kinase At1g80640 isoform X1 [Populus euphratica]
MNVLGLLLPMWALLNASLFFLLDARGESTPSTISASPLPKKHKPKPMFLFSSNMQAQSPVYPGMPLVPVVEEVHHQDLNKKILIALVVASTLLGGIVLFFSCFWIYRLKKSRKCRAKSKGDDVAKRHLPSPIGDKFNLLRMAGKKGSVAVMEYQLLQAATNNFREDNVLGQGGHGCVYKARFSEKLLAAVKRFEGEDIGREFENELNWLTKIQHQNIISLLGYCLHGQTRFLVYEMMQNGSLESQLHGPTHGSALTWHLRMKIAVDVARGLEYLHEHCNPPVVHRDLKSSNILLDSSFNAKLSDFGLAVTSGIQSKNIELSGTLGCVAPEYLLDGKLTDKSDVYAFGVLLLELLIGRKPVEQMSPDQCQSIVSWAMPQFTDRSKLPNIVDPVIKDTMDLKHLYQVAAVAVLCVQQEPSYRPLITDVLHSLIPLVPLELGGSLRVTEPVPLALPSH